MMMRNCGYRLDGEREGAPFTSYRGDGLYPVSENTLPYIMTCVGECGSPIVVKLVEIGGGRSSNHLNAKSLINFSSLLSIREYYSEVLYPVVE